MQKYYKRTSCPRKGNKWYTSVNYGGVSNCETDLPNKQFAGATIKNCVGYTWGRWFEAQAINGKFWGKSSNKDIAKLFEGRPRGDPQVAWKELKKHYTFKNYCKQTPHRGSIAFYERVPANAKFNGHVSFVEEVKSETCVDFSNCNLKTAPLWHYYDDVNPRGNFGNYRLLGYLWPINDFEGEQYRTTAVLRCRKTPGGDIVGTFDEGVTVTLAGDHKDLNGKPWKLVKGKGDNGQYITGYVSMEYLK